MTAAFLDDPPHPGRPGARGARADGTADLVAARRAELGLDDPLWQQYVHYLQGLFTGDLGTSLTSQLPVSDVIAQRLPATLALAVLAFLAASSSRCRSASRWAC